MHRAVTFTMVLIMLTLAVGASAGPLVRLRYAAFDPLAGEPTIPSDLRANPLPGEKSYYVVQFDGPILDGWKSDLQALGVELLDYIPDYAFIVHMTPDIASQTSHLSHVRWVGVFHPAYRIDPELLVANGTKKISVRMFPHESALPVVSDVERGHGMVHARGNGPGGEHVEASVDVASIRRIARHGGVSWIEPSLERRLVNNVARDLMNVWSPWQDFGIYGSGEIVAIADTGLDTGSLQSLSSDFAGRVLNTYALGRKNKWSDTNGHGTHVAGSVLGNGILSGSNPSAHSYSGSITGTAPEAQLVFQSVMDSGGMLRGIPADLNNLFQPTYDDGARIHTNSWGAAASGSYVTDSYNVDLFTWNHRDMTILFAAGNEGIDNNSDGVVDADSMSSPGTAKNCITVGATESYRLSGGYAGTYGTAWPSDYPVYPINQDAVSNSAHGMAAFSSRGPCNDGRIKPDVCAPGTNILSTRSHDSGAGTLWGVYNADYCYSGGTSMATPLTAGSVALVRQFYRTRKSATPSSALIKATLINGATDLSPGQYGAGQYMEIPARPNSVEGWGLVDLYYTLEPASPRDVRFVDNSTGLSTGGLQTYSYTITSSNDPFRVSLVWTDYPGSTAAYAALVNDLDLTVTMPNGQVRRGNGTTDRINNVEGVDISSPMTGTYTVTVNAYNVPHGPQPFALVVSGDMVQTLPTASITSPAADTTLYGSVAITGTAAGSSFQQYRLDYGSGASPTSWTQIGTSRATPVMDGTLGTWNTDDLANGVYTIRLTVTGSNGNSTAATTVNVLKTRLSQVKGTQSGPVTITGKVVSASKSQFGTFMYAQEPDRSSGIRIDVGSSQPDVPVGSIVTIAGTIGTSSNERVITDPTIIVTGTATTPRPLGMINRTVGGADLNGYAPGVTDGTGLNNIGLLVLAWGRVTFIGTHHFYLDDGSGLTDGSGHTGTKIYTNALTKPTSTLQYARVTGISSTEVSESVTRRMIRPRTQSDLIYY